MNIDFQMYPTRFYGRTWIPWAGILCLFPIICFWCVMGLSSLFELGLLDDKPEDAYVLILALLFMPMVIASVFQICVRQSPIFSICQEGMKIREVWIPLRVESLFANPIILLIFLPFALIIVPCLVAIVVFWRFVTWRLFQIQTFQLRWENVQAIYPEKDSLTIAGWCDKEHDAFAQDAPPEFLYPFTAFCLTFRHLSAADSAATVHATPNITTPVKKSSHSCPTADTSPRPSKNVHAIHCHLRSEHPA